MHNSILLVDDESAILRALNRLLRRAGYKVYTASSGEEALQVLEDTTINVVLSDFRMPHMTGGELLAEIQKRHQNIVGLVLSGYADLESVTSILNNGTAYKFLHKPWDDTELLAQIAWAFEKWEALHRQSGLTRMVMESDNALFEIDHEGYIANLTPAAAALCETTEPAATGSCISDFITAFTTTVLKEICQPGEVQTKVSCGSTIYVLSCSPSSDDRWVLSVAQQKRLGGLGIPELLHRDEIVRHIESWINNKSDVSVIYLDVSRFQTYNDSLGYQGADKLLTSIGKTLVATKPEHSFAGRLNGDEFVIISEGNLSDNDLNATISGMLANFETPISCNDREVRVSFNAAYALGPEDGKDPETLLKNAKSAVNYSKQRGRYVYPRYKPEMNAHSSQMLTIQTDLYRALERNEFSVVYQPKVSLKSGRILGAESLLRWKHATMGMISPATFIPMAEDSGLIETIGEWVLSTSATQSKIWQMDGLPPFLLSVNLSGRQLQEDSLLETVRSIIVASGIDATQLELEVTETFLMQDIDHSLALLHELKALGIRLALDDFGTGYSSLNYLSRLPVDTLKIDRSFVMDISESTERYNLVRNVIRMSHDLGMQVVAEGVETEEQLALLRELDCDEIQGYLISPPVPAEQFRTLLENQPVIAPSAQPKAQPVQSTEYLSN